MKISIRFFKDTFGWGFLLWLLGYLLGIILFFVVPKSMIGWIITPLAVAFTIWVLIKQIKSASLIHYLFIALTWTLLAVVLDYFLIVKAFNAGNEYYRPDVYLYYSLTFILPLLVGFWKRSKV
jgi:hypothetical protein